MSHAHWIHCPHNRHYVPLANAPPTMPPAAAPPAAAPPAAAPTPAASNMRVLLVRIPAGVSPGQRFTFKTPHGRTFSAVVPPNFLGQQLPVQVPVTNSPPPPAMLPPAAPAAMPPPLQPQACLLYTSPSPRDS